MYISPTVYPSRTPRIPSINITGCIYLLQDTLVGLLEYQGIKEIANIGIIDCKPNFKWPSMQSGKCPVYNGNVLLIVDLSSREKTSVC